MQLLSVNIGQKHTQANGDKTETTGIYKIPTLEPTQITTLGIREDFIGSSKHHGGPDQAIYVYGEPDYAWWSKELGKDLGPGTFGDNLTIGDLESASFNIGDRFHIRSAILEVTAPRIPCSTLASRMGDPQFIKRYRRAERPGLYCRVIREGTVQTGEAVSLEPFTGETVLAMELFRDYYRTKKDEVTLHRFLRAPIAIRARKDVEMDLEKLSAQKNSKPVSK
jgi:MOSC domain-containing protein YiiM